jgi:hypothetical protein
MPKDPPKQPQPSKVAPHVSLLFASVVILGVVIAYEFATKELRVANFTAPITLDAIVIDGHIRNEGGGQTCQPIFHYELNGKMWTTQLPASNPRSCYIKGSIVALKVDTLNPRRISDQASEIYSQRSRNTSLAIALVLAISGGLLRWRKYRR